MYLVFSRSRILTILLCGCVLVLTAGCATLQRNRVLKQADAMLNEANADFLAIHNGMTEEEVVKRLGPSDQTDRAGSMHWKRENQIAPTFGESLTDRTELTVKFDAQRRVSESTIDTKITLIEFR